jgi:hypothetical protein
MAERGQCGLWSEWKRLPTGQLLSGERKVPKKTKKKVKRVWRARERKERARENEMTGKIQMGGGGKKESKVNSLLGNV